LKQKPSTSTTAKGGSSPNNQSGTASRPPAGRNDSSTQPANSTDYDSPDRAGKQQPSLRRNSDPVDSPGKSTRSSSGGSQSDSGDDRQKPVLKRPGDSPDDQAQNRRGTGPVDQDGRNKGSDDDEVVRLESTLVNLPVLVSDHSGRYVPRLGKNDFLLWEDGVQQEIASFASEEVPFNVALMMDVSPSVQGSIRDIQDAAIDFVTQLRSQDRVMVISFDKNAHFLSDLTNDRRQLEMAIRSTATGSGTSVYDAVYEVVERLRTVDGRKALILFSDGEDTTSRRVGYDDAVEAVTESDVLVYGLRYPGTNFRPTYNPRYDPRIQIPDIFNLPWPIPWPSPRRRRGPFRFTTPGTVPSNSAAGSNPQWQKRGDRGRDFMTDITTAGGGPVFDAQTVADIRGLAARIAEELRHVYVVSYYPSNALSNGGYRSVRMRLRNRDDLAVRYRKGYSASRDQRGH
jgi:hypothetical protein